MKKAFTVNNKSVKPKPRSTDYDGVPPRETRWFKCSIYFKNRNECRTYSLVLAVKLRTHCPQVYFARYTNAVESRTDITFELPEPATPGFAQSLLSQFAKQRFKVTVPLPCSGSAHHAKGFDVVVSIWNAYLNVNPDDEHDFNELNQSAFKELADVEHWMANMMGLDYTDEAHLNLYHLGRIVNIFEHSIRLGNKLSDATKRVEKTKTKAGRN